MLRLRLPLARLLSAGEIIVGPGSLGSLRALPAGRIAVVSELAILETADLRQAVSKALGPVAHTFIEKAVGEPTMGIVQPVALQLTEFRPDWIVAVGGGSVIDCSKLAWVFYEHPTVDLERITRPFGLPTLRGKARLAAVPTTSGTGAEVSSAAMFTDHASGRKQAVVSHEFLPDVAILDAALAASAPPMVTAMSGLDALAHALEGYVSRFANPFLDMRVLVAARTVFARLEKCVETPTDLVARQEMMNAALVSGWVQNMKVPGIGHAVAHQLGQFGIPHGLACGALLSPAIRYNAEDDRVREKYNELAGQLGLNGAEGLAQACDDLRIQVGLGERLSKTSGRSSNDVWSRQAGIVSGAQSDICARANPRSVTDDAVASLLRAVW